MRHFEDVFKTRFACNAIISLYSLISNSEYANSVDRYAFQTTCFTRGWCVYCQLYRLPTSDDLICICLLQVTFQTYTIVECGRWYKRHHAESAHHNGVFISHPEISPCMSTLIMYSFTIHTMKRQEILSYTTKTFLSINMPCLHVRSTFNFANQRKCFPGPKLCTVVYGKEGIRHGAFPLNRVILRFYYQGVSDMSTRMHICCVNEFGSESQCGSECGRSLVRSPRHTIRLDKVELAVSLLGVRH